MGLQNRYVQRSRFRINLATKFLGVAALLCGSQALLNPKLPRFNADKAPVARCDKDAVAAIVYTGTPERVREGLRLLAERKVCKLLISGIDSHEPLDAFLSHFGVPVTSLHDISTDTAPNTTANADSSAKWVLRHPEIKEAVLITSSMHMPRAFILAERSFRYQNIHARLMVLPINDQNFDWHAPFSRESICYIEGWSIERAKLAATRLGLTALPWGEHIHAPSSRKQMIVRRPFPKYAQAAPAWH